MLEVEEEEEEEVVLVVVVVADGVAEVRCGTMIGDNKELAPTKAEEEREGEAEAEAEAEAEIDIDTDAEGVAEVKCGEDWEGESMRT